MTDKPDRDGILDPRASEPVAKPPEIEAFDRWAAEPDKPGRLGSGAALVGPRRRGRRRRHGRRQNRPAAGPRWAGTGAGAARAPRPAGRPAAPGGVCPLPAGRDHHRPVAAPHPESRRDVRRSPGRWRGLSAEWRGRGRQVPRWPPRWPWTWPMAGSSSTPTGAAGWARDSPACSTCGPGP